MNAATPVEQPILRSQVCDDVDAIGKRTWDSLIGRAYTSTVFQTFGWITAWKRTFGVGKTLIVPCVYQDDQLLGAGVFLESGDGLSFGAADRADYGDLLIDRDLDSKLQREVACELLRCARDAAGSVPNFLLDKVPTQSRSLELFAELNPNFYLVPLQRLPAPRLDMSVVDERLKKKSLKRHENGLKRSGEVEFHTYVEADDVLPRLEGFFNQHVARWRDTESPSLFNDARNREFYIELTRQLGGEGSLRYSELTLDGELVAAHFGFLFADTFIWYKPSYAIEHARSSPGEVLIRNLLRLAKEEGAAVFDFTIGGEAFKYRFATEDPSVANLYITSSWSRAKLRHLRFQLGSILDQFISR